jgi:hypothetical protein
MAAENWTTGMSGMLVRIVTDHEAGGLQNIGLQE